MAVDEEKLIKPPPITNSQSQKRSTGSNSTIVIDELGPESHYLVRRLGVVLSYYVTEVVLKRPADPIDYLARCLKNYIKANANEENEKREEKLIEELRRQKKLEEEEGLSEWISSQQTDAVANNSATSVTGLLLASGETEEKVGQSLSATAASVAESEPVTKGAPTTAQGEEGGEIDLEATTDEVTETFDED